MTTFIGQDGWPCSFAESHTGANLIKALRNLPKGADLPDKDVENSAHMIYSASTLGREEELPRNRPATRKKSSAELKRLSELADKLKSHIESLHQPAVKALYVHGETVFSLIPALEALYENSLHASGDVEEGKKDPGEKVAASEIALAAAGSFMWVTGLTPTLSRNDGKVRPNAWTIFLGAVYQALGFETDTKKREQGERFVSVEAQTDKLLKHHKIVKPTRKIIE